MYEISFLSSVKKDTLSRSMLVKIEYIQIVREKLLQIGLKFCGESLSGLDFVKKITKHLDED